MSGSNARPASGQRLAEPGHEYRVDRRARLRRETESSPLVRFFAYVRPHTRYVVGAALAGIGKFALPFAFPLAFKYVLDVLLVPQPTLGALDGTIDRWCGKAASLLGLGVAPQGKLVALTLCMLALYVIQSIASYYRNYWAGVAGNRLIFDLRCKLFAHLQRLPNSFFDRNPAGAVVSRMVNDVEVARQFVGSTMTDVWMDGVALLLIGWFLFLLDARLAIISLAVAPFYVLMIAGFSPRIRNASRSIQETIEDLSASLHERVVGAVTVKAFARESHEIGLFREQATRLYDHDIEKLKLTSGQQMLTELLTRAAPSIVVWAAAVMILGHTMTVGTLVAFIGFLGYIYQPLEHFTQLSSVVSSALSAIERIFALLDVAPDIQDHPLARPLTVKRGALEFDNVRFAYPPREGHPERTVLRDISFHIAGGSTVALVGRSGAGKTTLASLIPRFYDATSGRVLIDGRDVRHLTLKSLRENIAIVTQDTTLFSASVRENLLYGNPQADERALWDALAQANLKSFVESLPHRLDTVIGERGVRISGGQRQRLALARAFIKNAAILILDEATSAVDSESENLIHDAMRRLMEGRTSVLIAHRLRSAIEADMIIVLDAGRIVETGSHAELLSRRGLYAELYHEQIHGLAAIDPGGPRHASARKSPALGSPRRAGLHGPAISRGVVEDA